MYEWVSENNVIKKKDMSFGFKCEDVVLDKLKTFFNFDVKKTHQYHQYDFITKIDNKNIYIELKSRRNTHNQYLDTMLPYNKIEYAINRPDDDFYFFFNFTDGLYYQKYSKDYNYNIRTAGRCDRGKNEFKKYGFILNNDLIKI